MGGQHRTDHSLTDAVIDGLQGRRPRHLHGVIYTAWDAATSG
jgi:hypothetical protein